jgi:phospholipase/carboxylesterase
MTSRAAIGWLSFALVGCDAPRGPAAAPPAPTRASAPERTVDPSALEGPPAPAAVEAPPWRRGEAAGIEFIEWMGGDAEFEDVVPIVVAIHGLGDAPENFVHLVEGFDTPSRFIVPRAIDPHGEGWSWFPVRARDPDVEALSRGIADAADKIAAALRALEVPTPNSGGLVVTGFSQGGMLSFTLATRHPELFTAAIPVGGWLPPPLYLDDSGREAPYPWIVALHGDADPAVRIEPTRESVRHLSELGVDATLHEYPGVRHAIPPAMRAELHRLLRRAVGDTPRPGD